MNYLLLSPPYYKQIQQKKYLEEGQISERVFNTFDEGMSDLVTCLHRNEDHLCYQHKCLSQFHINRENCRKYLVMMLLSYILLFTIACPMSVPSVYLGLKVWKTKKDVLNRSSAFLLIFIGRQQL